MKKGAIPMKLDEARYLKNISLKALKLNDLYQESIEITQWLTRNAKHRIVGWRIVIEPIGEGYTYSDHAISIRIPKELGMKEIKALALACKKQAKEDLDAIKIDLKSVNRA